MGKVKEAVQKVVNLGKTILKIIKKIPTLLGHICFWIIIAIMLVVLLYIVAHILAEAIAKLLGIDSAGIDESKDYKVLQGLVSSGYNEVMPAEDLKNYYAYEYAILMDVARYIEETGVTTIPFEEADESVLTSLLSDDEWGILCAASFVAKGEGGFDSTVSDIKTKHKGVIDAYNAAVKAGRSIAENGGGSNEVRTAVEQNFSSVSGINVDSIIQKAVEDAISQANESNEMSKSELVYKSVTDSLTGQTSLVPYIVVARPCYRYKYSFIDKDMSEDETERDYKPILRKGAGRGYGMNQSITYTTQTGVKKSYANSWSYIRDNIYPLTANSTLNANNIALHKGGATTGTSQKLKFEDTGTYARGIIYDSMDTGTVTYEIPLKTLVDRFMPKAVLLSSWYMLKQNETVPDGEQITVDIVMQQIHDIYDKACLEKEDVPEKNWLLVKNVKASTGNYDVPEVITDSVFTMPSIEGKTSLSKYLMKGSSALRNQATDLIYSNYSTNYDCRGVSTPNAGGSAGTTTTTSQSIQESLLTPIKQSFGGTLEEDLINDLELILNHYMKDKNMQFTNSQYKKIIEDFTKQINGIDESSIQSLGSSDKYKEYIIYKMDRNGEYIIDCEKMKEDTPLHHSTGNTGTTHEQKYGHEEFSSECDSKIASEHRDPYADGAHVDCFIPYIRVAISMKEEDRIYEDGTTETVMLKSTAAIIIQNGDIGDLYRVDEKEIDDIAGLTNKETFIKFARATVKMDNIKDWVEENNASNLGDRMYFIVTDLFEAAPIKVDNINVGMTFKEINLGGNILGVYSKRYGTRIGGGIEGLEKALWNVMHEEAIVLNVEDALAQAGITDDMLYESGQLSIIRPEIVPGSREYDTTPPENAAPCDDKNGYDSNWGVPYGPGEAIISTDRYINVTKAGDDRVRKFVNALAKSSTDAIIEAILDKYDLFSETAKGAKDVKHLDKIGYFKNGTIKCDFYNSLSPDDILGDYVALFPVERKITTITQDVMERAITMYMPTSATTWSSNIKMSNLITRMGEFDPTCSSNGGYRQLIPRTSYNGGIKDLSVSLSKAWRTKFYAQYFSKVREADVLAMVSEWEKAANEGVFAANTYIRDLYSLIYYSKENAGKVDGLENENGNAYVNKNSYSYFYIPDEIIGFDETITDKAFWMERLLATSAPDNIKPEENLTMRTARSVKTWQNLDYTLYPECQIKDSNGNVIKGEANIYALWPLGGYLGRSLYAFEANASDNANRKIIIWGNYIGPGVHSGVDLYCRGNASRIYRVTHNGDEPYITATYNANGTVTLKSGGRSGATIDGNISGDEDTLSQYDTAEGTVSATTSEGAYTSVPITINIEGTNVTFNGTAAAVYGYELYRLTKAYKSGEKAQKIIDEELQKESIDSPLVAVAPGIVTSVKGSFRSGFAVGIDHADGSHTAYVHMKRWPEVQLGEYVGAGTIVGYEGTTGNSGGFHIHFEVNGAKYPMQFLYPFFTPFYYQEKVDEMKEAKGTDKILESEYLSIQRTVFPVGEYASGNQQELKYNYPSNQKGTLNQVENDEDGMVKIQNYVPTTPLCKYTELYKEDNSKVRDYTKLPENTSSLDKENYSGESVKALPQYFDKEFIALVRANGGHILVEN